MSKRKEVSAFVYRVRDGVGVEKIEGEHRSVSKLMSFEPTYFCYSFFNVLDKQTSLCSRS